MPLSTAWAGAPPVAARRAFDRFIARARGRALVPTAARALMPMSAAWAGSPPVAARRTFDPFIAAREGGR